MSIPNPVITARISWRHGDTILSPMKKSVRSFKVDENNFEESRDLQIENAKKWIKKFLTNDCVEWCVEDEYGCNILNGQ